MAWRLILRRLPGAVLAMLAVMLLPTSAWGTECPPDSSCAPADPEPTPTGNPEPDPEPDPETPPAESTDPEPPPAEPTPTPTVTVTAEPEPATDAPGVDTGVYLDPSTGSLRVDENTGVAVGVASWLAAVVAGLGTARLVLP